MYLFTLYLFVHFANVVHLLDPIDHKVHETKFQAAETAKLIDLVQKTDDFEVRYPKSSNKNDGKNEDTKVEDKAADTAKLIDLIHKVNKFEVKYPVPKNRDDGKNKGAEGLNLFINMKDLQKNYDRRRQIPVLPDQNRLQYIRNPEVLAVYRKSLDEFKKKQYTEAYDDISNVAGTQRSYFKELAEWRYFRANDNNRTGTGSAKGDVDDNNAAEDTKDNGRRRRVGEQLDAEDHGRQSDSLPAGLNTHKITLDYVKPIVEQVLTKLVLKTSQEEKSGEKYKLNLKNMSIETQDSDGYTNNPNQKKIVMSVKYKPSLEISNDNSKIEKNQKIKDNFFYKDDRSSKDKNIGASKDFILDPKVTIEDKIADPTNERIGKLNNNSNAERYNYGGSKNERTKHKNNTQIKKNKFNIENESDNKDIEAFTLKKRRIDWATYDEKKSAYIKGSDKAKINTKRNGEWIDKNDDWDRSNDKPRNSNEDIPHMRQDSDEKNRKKKKYELNKKDKDWEKKEIDWDIKDEDGNQDKDKRNKKDDDWNRNSNKRNKKDDNNYSKETNKKRDKYASNKNKKDDSKKFKKNDNLKKDTSWDDIGTNKKQNSEWGSYDAFKNIVGKQVKNEKEITKQDIAPILSKKEYKAPKIRWENSKKENRDRDYSYDKPKKQNAWVMHRTPIPIVGKRPLYAD